MIYLDNAATTKVFEEAAEEARRAMLDDFYNPNATYKFAVDVKREVEKSRRTIASAIGALPEELVFTSCATESNNWVINCARKNVKGNIVITAGEHSSVYEPAMSLKKRGVDVRVVPLDRSGIVDCEAFAAAVDGDTTLVSFIHVSNETGVINPVESLVSIVRSKAPHALIHSDGVQGLIKTERPVSSLKLDLYSASAHKLGAPKGIGLLYIRRGVNIAPYIYGGGQENALRSGTQNVPFIRAFAAAVSHLKSISNRSAVLSIRSEIAQYFESNGCTIVGEGENSGYILCVYFPFVKAEIMQNMLAEKGIIVGKGAACSGSKRGNRVLSAMGLTQKQIEGCVRISFFANTSADDVRTAAKIMVETAEKYRSGHVG